MKTVVDLTTSLKAYLLGKDTAAKQAVESNIAPVETDATSSTGSYVQGAQLILNDVLYDVTAAITAGDPLTVGTNIAAAEKLSTAIKSKQDQIEVTTMPTASAAYAGKVLIYIGATTLDYTSGQSYQCVEESASYSWVPVGGSGSVTAAEVSYDNTSSGMTADDVQEAVDELNANKQPKTLDTPITIDGTQQTTVEGALGGLNQALALKSPKSDLASISITGDTNNTGSTIATGTFFYKNGTLSRAIVDIANGATLTQNTNYTLVPDGGLNELLTVETGSLTSSHTINTLYTDLRKSGNVVSLIFYITMTSNVVAYQSVATIPSGFRPPANFYVANFNGDVTKAIGIQADGALVCAGSLSSGESWRGQAMWII